MPAAAAPRMNRFKQALRGAPAGEQPDRYSIDGHDIEIARHGDGTYRITLDGVQAALKLDTRPGRAGAETLVVELTEKTCVVCDTRSQLSTDRLLSDAGWNLQPGAYLCPEHATPGVPTYRHDPDLVEARPETAGSYRLWVRVHYGAGVALSTPLAYGHPEPTRATFHDRPDESELLSAMGALVRVGCRGCPVITDLAFPEDLLDDGWALTAEVELCPACNDLDSEELDAFNDSAHPYWDRRDAEELLASGHGIA